MFGHDPKGNYDEKATIKAALVNFKRTKNMACYNELVALTDKASVKLPVADTKIVDRSIAEAQTILSDIDFNEEGLDGQQLLASKWRRYAGKIGNIASHKDYILEKAESGSVEEKEYARKIATLEFDKNYFYIFDGDEIIEGKKEPLLASSTLELYPIPARDLIDISGDITLIAGIRIYDIQGRMLRELPGGTDHFTVGDMASGIYLVYIHLKNGHYESKKLVVE